MIGESFFIREFSGEVALPQQGLRYCPGWGIRNV